MPGKKRPSSAKTSALSKRHKSGGSGGSKPSTSSNNNKRPFNALPVERATPKASTSAFASAPTPGGKGKYKALDGVKKDKKGKGPAFISVPGIKREKNSSSDGEDSEDGDGESSQEESEDGDMQVDEELQDGEGVEFLTTLDQKGISA